MKQEAAEGSTIANSKTVFFVGQTYKSYRNGQYHGTSVCGRVHGPVGIVIVFCNFVYDRLQTGILRVC